MNFNKYLQSKLFQLAIALIGVLIIATASFGLGVFVGYHKARFSYSWGENYERNFGEPRRGIFGFFSGRDFTNAHGTFGSILGVSSSTLIINGRDGAEKTVLVSSSTIIRVHRDTIELSGLNVGDPVVVIGSPNDQGQINARLIRAFPQ